MLSFLIILILFFFLSYSFIIKISSQDIKHIEQLNIEQ